MSMEQVKTFIKKMKSDEAFSKRIMAIQDTDARFEAILEAGFDFTMEELSETGKEQFGNFTDFVKTFPEGYGFFCCRLKPGLSIRNGLFPLDEADYGGFTGNIFCVPVENDNLFIELAGNAFACLAPHPAVQ